MKEVIILVPSSSADYPKAPIYVGDLVRCNDCKWYQGVHSVQGHAPCEWLNKQVLWNDFCSDGEPYKGGDAK